MADIAHNFLPPKMHKLAVSLQGLLIPTIFTNPLLHDVINKCRVLKVQKRSKMTNDCSGVAAQSAQT